MPILKIINHRQTQRGSVSTAKHHLGRRKQTRTDCSNLLLGKQQLGKKCPSNAILSSRPFNRSAGAHPDWVRMLAWV